MFIKVYKGDLNRKNPVKIIFFSNTITTLLSFHNMNVPININLYQVEIKIRIRGGGIHSQ